MTQTISPLSPSKLLRADHDGHPAAGGALLLQLLHLPQDPEVLLHEGPLRRTKVLPRRRRSQAAARPPSRVRQFPTVGNAFCGTFPKFQGGYYPLSIVMPTLFCTTIRLLKASQMKKSFLCSLVSSFPCFSPINLEWGVKNFSTL